MARSAVSNGKTAIFPAGASEYMKRRLAESAGLALLAGAGALTMALLSYSPNDPSLNHAADGAVRNLLGRPGSYTADALIQAVGLAAAVPVMVAATWGLSTFRKRPIRRIGGRLLLGVLAMLLLAVGCSAAPETLSWPILGDPGGAAGGLLLTRMAEAMMSVGLPAPPMAISLVSGALGLLALVLTMGLPWSDWRRGAVGVAGAMGLTLRALRSGGGAIGQLAARQMRREPILERPARRKVRPKPESPPQKDLVAPRSKRTKSGSRSQRLRQGKLAFEPADSFEMPPLELLDEPSGDRQATVISQQALSQNAKLLEAVLEDFGVRGRIVKVRPGPVVTLYELEPAPGTKTSRVVGLSDDIARSMSAISVRVAVIPGRNVIGIELPNGRREMVNLRELLAAEAFERMAGKLTLALGKDISGSPVVVDLGRMPHLLIAGTTGSGKSVAINAMILSLLYQLPPDTCKFIMIDPKMLELSAYEDIPHLLAPVVTEPDKAVLALKWTVREMEERYRAMSQLGVRNIASYNTRLAEARKRKENLTRRVQTGFDPETGRPVYEEQPLSMEPLPFIVVVVDEMADLMLVAGKDIEAAVQRLAQMARAAGIHLIMATQRPSVDVITGTIKANFPTRISFQVTSKVDSRTILGEQGAEQLLGQGDMLYMAGGGRITRVHGPFVSEEEVEEVVAYLRGQGEPDYVEEVTEDAEPGLGFSMPGNGKSEGDELYDEAVALIAREGKASTSFVQRHLQIGYNRAARIIERMEAEGLVSKPNRVGRREVLIGHGDHGE